MKMSDEGPETNGSLTTALARAATTAGTAPSVHNTQPWRWRVLPERLELFAARDRQLVAADPDGQLLTLSCGATLHHARLTLAADGYAVRVERLPDPTDPDLLARLVPTGRTETAAEAARLLSCVSARHTDRRSVSTQPVPEAALTAIVRATAAQGARLQLLTDDQVLELAASASRAAETEAEHPKLKEELAYWTGRGRPVGTGLPANVLPDQAAQTTVPSRDFGTPGSLPVGSGHDRAAVYGLLFGDDDEPESWLRAGEGLSAAWLTATERGVSVVPLSGVVEVTSTRAALRRMLAGLGYPYLVLRLGIAEPAPGEPAHTPRLPADQVVDTSAIGDQGK